MIPDQIALPEPAIAVEQVAERRGSRVWRVTLPGNRHIALKYATDNADQDGIHAGARQLAAREAAVLSHLNSAELYAQGETSDGTWLAVVWHPGPSIAAWWRHIDDQTTARRDAAKAALAAASAVADLHNRGWRHGDLQPAHILIDGHGPARLIDLALAQGSVQVTPDLPYRGALAHLTAPETARQILATPPHHHISLTAPAEVYMFGATLYTAWTKQWPHTYDAAQPHRLSVPDIHTAISAPGSRRPLPTGWPAMADAVGAMLEPTPADRPTAAQIVDALTDLANQT